MTVAILWFRRDLRLADHEALTTACQNADRLIPVYVHDPESDKGWPLGAASRWWLHHSLCALSERLRQADSRLTVWCGKTETALPDLAELTGATQVYCSRVYDPNPVANDARIAQLLAARGVSFLRFGGTLLHEPESLLNASGAPYRVFTPFWKACQRLPACGPPLPVPARFPPPPQGIPSLTVDALELLPRVGWEGGLADRWQPGEQNAEALCSAFCSDDIAAYTRLRDVPSASGTSRLSPYLHLGEITPRQILWQASSMEQSDAGSTQPYIRQLGWREFAHHLLHYFPHTPDKPLDPRFTRFPWRANYRSLLQAWQSGETGIPLVDAGMRELWKTGWMHNRVRMIAASFLTKNLRIPWQEGARWFWDTLVDADLANNTLGWQWVAGCGADAAPYFRIFNPVLQGERFDKQGRYVRRWLPELGELPDRWLQQPWNATPEILSAAKIRLGIDYPHPVVDLAASRRDALVAYDKIKRLKN
ncbi:MAG: deoxyribodipyrimidine photo-lyase [Proteobacteria bacterium]|nr:MAG: deoxyribodipyrimidine photo-lyase [Pseudomonadota bacterium]